LKIINYRKFHEAEISRVYVADKFNKPEISGDMSVFQGNTTGCSNSSNNIS
jgi:hypothetical protein